MLLKTNILYLKPLDLSELDEFIRALQSNETFDFGKLPNRYRNQLFLDCLTKDIRVNVSNKNKDYLFYTIWLIIQKETSAIIGHVFFNGTPNFHGEVELYFEIFDEKNENLVIKECLEAMIVWASTNKKIRNLKTTTPIYKQQVSAIMAKTGFEKSTPFQHFESWIWKNTSCQ